jgi:hypothetical protein
MRIEYALYVRHEVYQALRSVRGASRDRIVSFIESLAANPFAEGDYRERDDTGRECQVRVIGTFAVVAVLSPGKPSPSPLV